MEIDRESNIQTISIHAPREGRDDSLWSLCWLSSYFNPRAPRGARLTTIMAEFDMRAFQSTRPARGATR